MFLPRGQTKVSLSLVGAAIIMKYLIPTQLLEVVVLKGRIGLQLPRIPVGQGQHVPVQPDPPATQIIAPGIPLRSTVCLSCWFIGLELDTHTNAEINIGQFL